MSFGIANNVKSEVRACTPDLLNAALDSVQVAKVCAELEDALEKCRRGEIAKEDYETLKGALKKKLPILTFHATFKNGRRKNEDALPSGLSIYDLDHIENPRGRWLEIEPRKEELGIVLAHITPSTEGLRLVFVMPQGMNLADAQAWMASQLGDDKYDACVKDYARCSFAVPREYVLFVDEAKMFSNVILSEGRAEAKNLNASTNTSTSGIQTLRDAQSVGALLGYLLGEIGPMGLTMSLGFASGAMLYVVFGEILPQSILMYHSKLPAFSTIVGILAGMLIIF